MRLSHQEVKLIHRLRALGAVETLLVSRVVSGDLVVTVEKSMFTQTAACGINSLTSSNSHSAELPSSSFEAPHDP